MKKIWIFLIILVVTTGGFFYWLWTWQPEKPDLSIGHPEEAPTLFSKEDYKIEEREDGKYIVVEKVGLTAKVPEGWRIEFEGSDIPEPEYWVNLYSPDFETTTGNVLKTGCIISITAQTAKKTHQELIENIKILQENPEEATRLLKEDYVLAEDFTLVNINDYDALEIIFQESSMMGGGMNINIPFGDYKLISLGLGFPLEYKEKCSSRWEEFLRNVVIE
ncbi:hypothetical protein J7K42_02865 [bacterium]|nr:hypothetical protein [bacterium]